MADEWPTPVVWSGFEIGIALLYPATSIDRDYSYVTDHPVAESYRRYQPPPHDVPSDFPTNGQRLTLCRGAGCQACHHTGYRGRMGIFELMVTNDLVHELCVQRVNATTIRNQAIKDGMLTLRQDGWRKVLEGKTTLEEVSRVTKGDIVL